MAYNKLPKLPTWAEDVTSQPLDLGKPSDPEIRLGFIRTPTPPKRKWFNWVLNSLMDGLQYLTRRGIADWDVEESYVLGDKAVSPVNGKVYQAKENTTGNEPSASPAKWERWGITFGEGDTRYALVGGNSTQRFKVSDALATNEAVSLNQLNSALNTLDQELTPLLVEYGDTSYSQGVGYIYYPSTGLIEIWGYMSPAGLISDLFPVTLDYIYNFHCTPVYDSTVPDGGAATVQLRNLNTTGFSLASSLEAESDDVFHADGAVAVYWRVTGKRNTPP